MADIDAFVLHVCTMPPHDNSGNTFFAFHECKMNYLDMDDIEIFFCYVGIWKHPCMKEMRKWCKQHSHIPTISERNSKMSDTRSLYSAR